MTTTNRTPKRIVCGDAKVPVPLAVSQNGRAYFTTGPIYCLGDLPDGSRWRVIIPAGFWSDGPSIPLPLQALFWLDNTGEVLLPGILHDWAFRNAGAIEVGVYPAKAGKTGKRRWVNATVRYSRRECNLLMLAAMKGHGVPFWRRRKIMLGLALGSWKSWRKHSRRNEAVAALSVGNVFGSSPEVYSYSVADAWKIARKDYPDQDDPTDTWWLAKYSAIRKAVFGPKPGMGIWIEAQ